MNLRGHNSTHNTRLDLSAHCMILSPVPPSGRSLLWSLSHNKQCENFSKESPRGVLVMAIPRYILSLLCHALGGVCRDPSVRGTSCLPSETCTQEISASNNIHEEQVPWRTRKEIKEKGPPEQGAGSDYFVRSGHANTLPMAMFSNDMGKSGSKSCG